MKKSGKGKRDPDEQLQARARAFFASRGPRKPSPYETAKALGITFKQASELARALSAKQKQAPGKVGKVTGVLRVSGRGYPSVHTADGRSVPVTMGATGDALPGDTVEAVIEKLGGAGRCSVTRVVARGGEKLTGRLLQLPSGLHVQPAGWPSELAVRVEGGPGSPGDFVTAHVSTYPQDGLPGAFTVERVIGRGPVAELRAIAIAHELRDEFPADALQEAERLADVGAADAQGRRDLRAQEAFTIDGADAQDFDDAVYLEREGGDFRLYVHIADVSHYVRPGGALEREAYLRGNSVYLPGLTLPMLPERLSNNLCSLRPGEDRLCVTAELVYGPDGGRRSAKAYPSVIHSAARMTYERVNELIRGAAAGPHEAAVAAQIPAMLELSALLRGLRARRGSLDLDVPEAHIALDADGHVTDVSARGRDQAEMLIEDFMIAANEAVALRLRNLNLPCLYRVHEPPDGLAVADLGKKFAALHVKLRMDAEGHFAPMALQEALESAEPSVRGILGRLVLRAMKRAEYLPQPIGHYGLAAEDYCHFTSPIRRYADLFVHRVLKGPAADEQVDAWRHAAPDAARQASVCERMAQEAEWEAQALRCAQFMEPRIGETFEACVTGMTRRLLFLTLPSAVELTMPILYLEQARGDAYAFDEERLVLVGRRSKRAVRLGQILCVVIDAVNLDERRVLCKPVPEEAPAKGKRRK